MVTGNYGQLIFLAWVYICRPLTDNDEDLWRFTGECLAIFNVAEHLVGVHDTQVFFAVFVDVLYPLLPKGRRSRF